jgi:glycosidase
MTLRGPGSRFPLLYQLNTRVLVSETAAARGRPATLDDLPEELLERAAARGFRWLWMLGVWQTGPLGQLGARAPESRADLRHDLPDLADADIVGSPFAIVGYDVHRDFGGDQALARLRQRMHRHHLRLMVDFVPNHVALDHPWVDAHPEFLIAGDEEDLHREPKNYVALQTAQGRRIFAHGRDPNFFGWNDTLQLNYRHGGLRAAMVAELERIAERADGVRCDMAMLLEPEVIARTWGERARPRDGTPSVAGPFWPAAISRIRQRHPQFLFVAEAYWGLEWSLLEEGFDFTYDKRLYDRLRAGEARPVREHLGAAPAFRDRTLHFLENHDEPRAAAIFPPDVHRAAAVTSFLAPGLRLFHEGQLEGRRAHAAIHLGRRMAEKPDEALVAFYERLLACLRRPETHDGLWRLCACRAAWAGNPTWNNFIVFTWQGPGGDEGNLDEGKLDEGKLDEGKLDDGKLDEGKLLVAINYAPTRGQCYAEVALGELEPGLLVLTDLLGDERHEREARTLSSEGLYLDLPAWGTNVFDIRKRPS